MKVVTHLTFDGECELAFKLYERLLGGTIKFMITYADSPGAPVIAGFETKIFHATLDIVHQTLTGLDVAPGQYERPKGFHLQLNLDDPDKAKGIFGAFAEGGSVHLALQQTFWAAHYGIVTDRFGIPWEINGGPSA